MATLGYEWTSQAPDLDAVIVPIGGGGLATGVSTAMRLANPSLHIYGVEPEGSDAMCRSFVANHTIKMGAMHSIADSLMAPHTERSSTATSYAAGISTKSSRCRTASCVTTCSNCSRK